MASKALHALPTPITCLTSLPTTGTLPQFTPALWTPCHPLHRPARHPTTFSLYYWLFLWPRTFLCIHPHDSLLHLLQALAQVSCSQ